VNSDEAAGSVLARLNNPAGEHTRFAVIADPHVSTRSEGTSKLFEQTEEHFEAAIEDINKREVDAVLSPGDLTKDGEPWNYDAVDKAVSRLDAPFLAVPGNHDVPKSRDEHNTADISWFAKQYGPGTLPFHTTIGGMDVVGVNSAGTRNRLFESHDGRVTDEDRAWLRETLTDAGPSIVLVHHNFPPVSDQISAHREAEPEMHLPPVMRDPKPFADALAEGGADLVFTGHYHLPATGRYAGVREIAAPTTCSFPQAYLLCETTPNGTVVRFIPIGDEQSLGEAHAQRTNESTTSRGLTAIAAARVASLPLVDEHNNK
jgi:3',5'-cyclic AMP phosphodiesterase CpdA